VPAPILSTAIAERFASRGEEDFANRVLSAMRVRIRRPSGEAGMSLEARGHLVDSVLDLGAPGPCGFRVDHVVARALALVGK